MNYTELLAFIDSEGVSVEDTFTTNIDQYIENAELKIQRDLKLDNMREEDAIVISAGTNTATIADKTDTQYIATRFVRVSGGATLKQKDESFLDDYDPTRTATGVPRYYALTTAGNLRVAPNPATDTTILWNYKARLAPLSSSNTENWLSKYIPDLYRAAMMIEVGIFNKLPPEEMQPYYEEYKYRLNTARSEARVANMTDEYRKATPTPLRQEIQE